MIKALFTLFFIGAFIGSASADLVVVDYVQQDRSGFYSLSKLSIPQGGAASRIVEEYKSDEYPIFVKGSPSQRWINDKRIVNLGVLNPDVELEFSVDKRVLAKLLRKKINDTSLKSSDVGLLGVLWKFPKEYYFYRTPEAVEADEIFVRAWHPFRVDAQIKYSLNEKTETITVSRWMTKNEMLCAYDNGPNSSEGASEVDKQKYQKYLCHNQNPKSKANQTQ